MNVGILRSDKDYDKIECFSSNSFTELWKQFIIKKIGKKFQTLQLQEKLIK